MRKLLAALTSVRAASGARSRLRLLRLRLTGTASSDPVPVRTRALGGQPLWLRPKTTDALAYWDAYTLSAQTPPPEIRDDDLRAILDLGTNIGAGLAALAHRYPKARLLGVEPDGANAALARRNLQPWGDRCTVVEAGVWSSQRDLVVEGDEEYGYRVREKRDEDAPGLPTVKGVPVGALIDEHFGDEPVDFALVEIERSEQLILTQATEWTRRVRAIKVETYSDQSYTPQATVRDLERLGFQARLETYAFGAFAVGIRQDTPSR